MQKKRLLLGLSIVLLLLIIFSSQNVFSFECINYDDCNSKTCFGCVRACSQTTCLYSDCINVLDDFTIMDSNSNQINTGFDSMLTVIIKLIFLIVVVILFALIIPILNVNKKLKLIIILISALCLIIFSFYILGGKEIFLNFLSLEKSTWDSDKIDQEIMWFINKEKLDTKEAILKSNSKILGGKEFVLLGPEYETSLIILEPINSELYYEDNTILDGFSKENVLDHLIHIKKGIIFDTYVWEDNDLIFFLTGESIESKRVLIELLKDENDLFKNQDYINNLDQTGNRSGQDLDGTSKILGADGIQKSLLNRSDPPVITIMKPIVGIVNTERLLSFYISDSDSGFNQGSLIVNQKEGVFENNCILKNSILNCSSQMDFVPGINKILIQIKDLDGNLAEKQISFVYDNTSFDLVNLYPQNNDYFNVPDLLFQLIDPEKKFSLDGFYVNITNNNNNNNNLVKTKPIIIPLGNHNCKSINNGFECNLENINLSEGENQIKIYPISSTSSFSVFFDKTSPTIKITPKGFIVTDNLLLKNDSLFIDYKRYSLDNCYKIQKEYHCQYTKRIGIISVNDEAGNSFSLDNKLVRGE